MPASGSDPARFNTAFAMCSSPVGLNPDVWASKAIDAD